jgi:hypothetical protein
MAIGLFPSVLEHQSKSVIDQNMLLLKEKKLNIHFEIHLPFCCVNMFKKEEYLLPC